MIPELTTDLLTKVKSVTELQNRVSLTLGAGDIDPLMQAITIPAAWILFSGDQNVDQSQDARHRSKQKYHFAVYVIIGYGTDESDMIDNQYPILDTVSKSVAGTDILVTPVIMKWKYEGQAVIHAGADRLVYEQRYSIAGVI